RSIMYPGYECEIQPEMLFVNGNTKLRRVCSLSQLGPAKWFLDYDTQRIYMYDNPSNFSVIETTAVGMAFAGNASGVEIENLTVEKYGPTANSGAVGQGWTEYGWERGSKNWAIRHLTAQGKDSTRIHDGARFCVQNPQGYE